MRSKYGTGIEGQQGKSVAPIEWSSLTYTSSMLARELVSLVASDSVILAKAGIYEVTACAIDSRLRGNDGPNRGESKAASSVLTVSCCGISQAMK